jgi:hypothetical protein
MTTPSGQISLNDVNVELGIPGTTVITMNDANVRTLAGVGGSGTVITMQNLQGKSNRVSISATISSNTSNYTLNTAKAPGYSSGKTDMTLTINPSIYVSSSSTGSYALQVDTSWNAADTVTIVNNGIIIGRGGDGGAGADIRFTQYGNSGSPAGPALYVQRALTLNNLNRISGGGGGGGGANYSTSTVGKSLVYNGGGGGGGGIGVSSGGSGGPGDGGSPGSSGTAGSLTSHGGGGSTISGSPGGSGGSYGASGSNGAPNGAGGGGPSGGSAGACIVGNSNITYTNTGTRNGSIS